MRRIIALFLAVLFGLGPLMAAIEVSDDARLPACCRRHGAHHCAMSEAMMKRMVDATSHEAFFTSPSHCPYYPGSSAANITPLNALTPSLANLPALFAKPHSPAAAHVAALPSQIRTRASRGPPVSSSF